MQSLQKITIAFLLILLVISVSGCETINSIISGDKPLEIYREDVPLNAAKLGLINISSVENFEAYVNIIDNFNALIKILNEQKDVFDIPEFNPTYEGWEKASKFIIEYGPLIDNYNGVVSAAKKYEEFLSDDRLHHFYIQAAKFGFEAALIVGTVFYTAAFEVTGIMYRAVGLNKFALKCGSCVSVVLGNTHWFIRTTLVEGASQTAQLLMEKTTKYYDLLVPKDHENNRINQFENVSNNSS